METRTKLGALVALLAAGFVWWHFTPPPAPVGSTVIAQQAPELKGQPKQDITPPKVAVFTQPAKKKLDLPAAVQDDPDKHALDSSKVSIDTHPHTITTVIDEKTGDVQTYDRRDPLPWLAAEQTGELRIDYGFKNYGVKVGRISVHEDVLAVKAMHAGVNASLDTDGSFFVGGGVGYKW